MSNSVRPDVLAYMDAYKLLGTEYSADSSQVRRAYLRLVRQHHPDKFPAGSVEQHQATAATARINEAYRLVRDAPLRYHRVSQASDPDTPWTDTELDDAIRQARTNRKVDLTMTTVLVVVMTVLAPIVARSLASSLPPPIQWPVLMVLGLGSSLALWTVLGPRAWHALYKLQLGMAIFHMLRGGRFF